MIRVWILVLFFSSAASIFGLEPKEAAKTLRWKFTVGQKLRVATQSEMTRTTKIKANVDDGWRLRWSIVSTRNMNSIRSYSRRIRISKAPIAPRCGF
jgi:hypothetical protein